MTERFNPRAGDLQPCEVGPLASHLAGFAALIRTQGYCTENGWMKIRLVADLSTWMKARRVAPRQLDERQVATFLKTRWKRIPHNSIVRKLSTPPGLSQPFDYFWSERAAMHAHLLNPT